VSLVGAAITTETADLIVEMLVLDRNLGRAMEIVSEHPMASFQIASHRIGSADCDVRLQLAVLLGRIATFGAVELLGRLSGDLDARVNRAARASLGNIDPGYVARLSTTKED
jgi:hypothetical protein